MKHHTKDKGDLATAEVILDLTRRGFKIFLSMSEHLPFDIVGYKDYNFKRIQVKHIKKYRGGINLSSKTNWADRNGTHKRAYDKEHIDLFAIYCPDNGEIYYVDPHSFESNISLRIDPSKGIGGPVVNLARDFKEI